MSTGKKCPKCKKPVPKAEAALGDGYLCEECFFKNLGTVRRRVQPIGSEKDVELQEFLSHGFSIEVIPLFT